MKVEFVYDQGCPNAEMARKNLTQSLEHLGITGAVGEYERSGKGETAGFKKYASPTILIDSEDLFPVPGELSGEGACRFYIHENGLRRGYPSLQMICVALIQRKRSQDQ